MSRNSEENNLIPSTNPSNATIAEVLSREAFKALVLVVTTEVAPRVLDQVRHIASTHGAWALESLNRHFQTLVASNPFPLITAAGQGNNDLIQDLLKHGTNINQQDNLGNTALFYVSNNTTAAILIDRGINFNLQNNNQQTTVNYLSSHDQTKELASDVQTLIDIKVALNIQKIREVKEENERVNKNFAFGFGAGSGAGLLLAALAIIRKCKNNRNNQVAPEDGQYATPEEIEGAITLSNQQIMTENQNIDPTNVEVIENEADALLNSRQQEEQNTNSQNPNPSVATPSVEYSAVLIDEEKSPSRQ